MFHSRKSQRVGPLTKKGSEVASFLSPRTATSDPAHMFVAGQLNQSAANFDELQPSTSRSDAKNHLDGAGDFESTGASHLQPKRGAALKRLFKSRRAVHRHQQRGTVSDPPDEPEPTSPDKKGKSQKGLLKWIYNKLKPRRKSFKSAEKEAEQKLDYEAQQIDPKPVHTSLDPCSVWSSILAQDQELDNDIVSTLALNIQPKEELKSSLVSPFTGETVFEEIDVLFEEIEVLFEEIDVLSATAGDSIPAFSAAEKNSSDTKETAENNINTAIKSCGKDLCERTPAKTLEKIKEQVKDGSSQAKDSRQAGNVVIKDNRPLESHMGSVEIVEGNTDTPGSHRVFTFKKNIFFFDTDPSFIKNKQHSNARPVCAEKLFISGDTDTESILSSHRISAKSAVTDQQLEKKQDEDHKESEYISSNTVGSLTEPSSHDLFLDTLESPRQSSSTCLPNQGRRSPTELSFNQLSDNFERRIYRRCLEIYMNACLRQWREMNPRGTSESATADSLTEPASSTKECWTETVQKKQSPKPEAPPKNVGSNRSRFKRFRNLVRTKLSRLFKMRIVVTIYL